MAGANIHCTIYDSERERRGRVAGVRKSVAAVNRDKWWTSQKEAATRTCKRPSSSPKPKPESMRNCSSFLPTWRSCVTEEEEEEEEER